jgi:hypothetical protein
MELDESGCPAGLRFSIFRALSTRQLASNSAWIARFSTGGACALSLRFAWFSSLI